MEAAKLSRFTCLSPLYVLRKILLSKSFDILQKITSKIKSLNYAVFLLVMNDIIAIIATFDILVLRDLVSVPRSLIAGVTKRMAVARSYKRTNSFLSSFLRENKGKQETSVFLP